jgi:hypothetical protein
MARVKGTAILGPVKNLRYHRKRAAEVLSPRLHHYLRERIVVASWYPEEDFVGLLQANLKLTGLPFEEGCDRLGVIAAQEHFAAWYGKHINEPNSRTLMLRVPSLWSAQHDTGRHDFYVESPTTGRIELKNFKYTSRELCLIIMSYTREFIRLMGLGDVKAEESTCVLKGDEYCSWRFEWTKELP